MRRAAAALAFLAGACSTAPAGLGYASGDAGRRARGEEPVRYASPGRIVAAEIAFAQLARRKGQWTAFRETAADDAVMFVPQAVGARDWLRGRKDPPRAVSWAPHRVWMSCDGSLAATYGAWHGDAGRTGYFTTVWQRQKNGEYEWVMDQGDDLATPLQEPEMIGTAIASCEPLPPATLAADPVPGNVRRGASRDRTLAWTVRVDPSCGRIVELKLHEGTGKPMTTVLTKRVEPPNGKDGGAPGSCGNT
ncbi:hypothetical protein [Novosphingobium sp. M1R2S20]|uniref:Uncharacterized protein n=1 Tax=Novosphingobium rhizovicinum TaxID=3228928 RepID=A0ABV3R982_9SPHN